MLCIYNQAFICGTDVVMMGFFFVLSENMELIGKPHVMMDVTTD